MYGGGFGHDDLGRVVDLSGRATIMMIADLDDRWRSHKEQGRWMWYQVLVSYQLIPVTGIKPTVLFISDWQRELDKNSR